MARLKQLTALLVLLACAPALAATRPFSLFELTERLYGSPSFLGVVVATTTKNNHDTATPFNNTGEALKAKVLLVQCDAAAYVLAGTANTATVTTANGVKLAADEKAYIGMTAAQGWIAFLSVSGTANCRCWEVL